VGFKKQSVKTGQIPNCTLETERNTLNGRLSAGKIQHPLTAGNFLMLYTFFPVLNRLLLTLAASGELTKLTEQHENLKLSSQSTETSSARVEG